MTKRLVVAYGGSLDGAAAISDLAHRLEADLATLTLDLGQGMDLEQVRDQARAAGARRAHVVDARRELAGQILRPALTAGAFESGPRAIAVTRPVIAAHLVAVARMEGAREVAHRASGLDRARFERLIAALAPELTIHAMADTNPEDSTPRIDQNLWGRTVTMSAPADQWELAPSDAFTRTSAEARRERAAAPAGSRRSPARRVARPPRLPQHRPGDGGARSLRLQQLDLGVLD